jgi:Protein of unknown function (DUF2723)
VGELSVGRLVAVGVVIAALLVYLATLLPGMAFGDWGEMQVVPHILGIPHPTGYPTYLLLAAAVDQVPIGSVAFRGNVLAAVLTALSLGVAVVVQMRLGVGPLIAAGAALLVGLTGIVWAEAIVAEANPLHLLFAALLIHRALVWADGGTATDLAIGGLLVGLSLGNHLLTVTIAPFVALFVLWTGRDRFRLRPWWLLVPLLGIAAGLLVYLYLPIRAAQNPPLDYNDPETMDRLLDLVSGTQFKEKFDFLSERGLAELRAGLEPLWAELTRAATPAFPIVGVIGLVVLAGRRPSVAAMLAGIVVGALYVYLTYESLEHYLLVPMLVFGIGVGVALEALAQLAAGASPGRLRVTSAAVGVVALVLASGLGVMNLRASDRSQDRRGEAYRDQVLAALPDDAVFLSYWHVTTPIWYAQLVDGLRPDVTVIDDSDIVHDGWQTRETAIAAFVCERPVLIIRPVDFELDPVRRSYALETVTVVEVAATGPSAVIHRPIHRVIPDGDDCGG